MQPAEDAKNLLGVFGRKALAIIADRDDPFAVAALSRYMNLGSFLRAAGT